MTQQRQTLRIPSKEPALSTFANAKHGAGVLPMPLYLNVSLSPSEIESLLFLFKPDSNPSGTSGSSGTPESDANSADIQLAQPYDFSSRPLQEIYQAHVDSFRDKGPEPSSLKYQCEYFAVLLHKDFTRRNFYVFIFESFEPGGVDGMMLNAEELKMFAPNMAVGNEEWMDYKEAAEEGEDSDVPLPVIETF